MATQDLSASATEGKIAGEHAYLLPASLLVAIIKNLTPHSPLGTVLLAFKEKQDSAPPSTPIDTAQKKPARPQISQDYGGSLSLDLEACEDVLDMLYCDAIGIPGTFSCPGSSSS